MPGENATERFVQHLTEIQTRLLAYIAMLLGDPAAARDVLQETNLVLWRKSSEFTEGTNFVAWARAIAKYQVLGYLRDAKRDRHLFGEALVESITVEAEPETEDLEIRHSALHVCLEKLTQHQRTLLESRYTEGHSIQEIADSARRTHGSVAMSLSRIRQSLLECIEHRMAGEAAS